MRLRMLFPLLLAATAPVAASSAPVSGYLEERQPDLSASVPPPPKPGTLADQADRKTFRTGRPSVGSDRWRMAIIDADEAVPSLLRDFSDAVGVDLTLTGNPNLTRLLTTLRFDTAATNELLKARFRRPRPFLRDPGPVCQDKHMLAQSFDFPSGHTVWGTSIALILAELRPDRASQILARGRAYGDSRVACGAHSISAVIAARQVAAGLVATLHGSARFRTDLEAARVELHSATADIPQ